MIRRLLLFAVVLGVMAVSIHGQVEVTSGLLGFGFAVTLAVVLDAGALLALNEVLTTRAPEVRRWGWTALLLASGLSVGLNVWHAVSSGTLPLVAAVAVGAIPVVLAGVLSHLLALSLATQAVPPVPSRPGSTPTDPVPVPPSVPTTQAPHRTGVPGTVPSAPVGPVGTSSPATAARRPDTRDGVTAATEVREQRPPRRPLHPPRSTLKPTTNTNIESLPTAAQNVWRKARELDIKYRNQHGRPMPYAKLREQLSIGQSTVVPLYKALADAAEADDAASAVADAGTTESPATDDISTGHVAVPQAGVESDAGPAPAVGTATGTPPRLALVPDTSTDADQSGTDHETGAPVGTEPASTDAVR